MGIKERREREKHYVRSMIMKIVNQIVSEEGWGGVTIRKIADEIEYSPPIIYEHFDSKDAILFELTKEAMEKLLKAVTKELESIQDSHEAICQITRTYYDFCIANRGYAKAILGLDGIPCGVHLEIEAWKKLIDLTKGHLAKVLVFNDREDPKLEESLHYYRWLTRGAISAAVIRVHMEEKDPPFNDHEQIKKMMVNSVEALITGLKPINSTVQ